MKKIFCTVTLLTAVTSLFAAKLNFVGYSGNSGTADNPVTLSTKTQYRKTQLAPVYDADAGVIYMSANLGQINAYSIDGRLIATYSTPRSDWNMGDPMVIAGKNIYFRNGEKLHALPLNAKSGKSTIEMPLYFAGSNNRIKIISSSCRDNKIAILLWNNDLYMFDASTKKAKKVGTLDNIVSHGHPNALDWNSKGELFAVGGKVARLIKDGELVKNETWPKTFVHRANGVFNGIFIDGSFYGAAYHGTLTRLQEDDFEANPGVVLGGASGYVIAQVYSDPDLTVMSGMTKIGKDLFALGGFDGVIILAQWNPKTKKMDLKRRIGGQANLQILMLDNQGNLIADRSIREWRDEATAPAKDHNKNMSTVATTIDDEMFLLGENNKRVYFSAGSTMQLNSGTFANAPVAVPLVAAAGFVESNKKYILLLDKKGDYKYYNININQRSSMKEISKGKFVPKSPVKSYNDLIKLDNNRLLAAADNSVILFVKEGNNWNEESRWDHNFETNFRFSGDSKGVAIVEKDKNLLSIYSADGKNLILTQSVAKPTLVSFRNSRIAVYESENQRINKYELED